MTRLLPGLNAANEGLAKSEVPGGGSSNNGTGNNDGSGNGNTQQKPNGSKPGDSLVQTGDPALVAVGATGLIGSHCSGGWCCSQASPQIAEASCCPRKSITREGGSAAVGPLCHSPNLS